jgi:hypothetical protein
MLSSTGGFIMNQKILSRLLQAFSVLVGLIGAVAYIFVMPQFVNDLGTAFPEFGYITQPAIISIFLSAAPILVAAVAFWMICNHVAQDRVFVLKNSKLLTLIYGCALIDSAYIACGSIVLSITGASNGGVLIVAVGIVAAGLCIACAAKLLAILVEKQTAAIRSAEPEA